MDMKKGKKNKKIKGIALVIAGVLAATAYGGVQYHEKPKSTEVSVQVQESQHAAEAIKVKNISKKALNVKGKTRQSKNTEKNSNVVKYTVLDDSETVKITYKDGSVYEGNVDKNKKRSGQGTLWVTDGTTYTGEWKKDAINGKGECRTSDGSVLSGKFKKYSLKNGTYTYTDGKQSITRYIKKGKLTSQVHITVEGNNYDGSIRDGELEGKSYIVYANGDIYDGTLSGGLKSGTGTYTWTSGDHYVGEWNGDVMSGSGKYYFSAGEAPVLEGDFANNKPDGNCTYYRDDGKIYDTQWVNGVCIRIQ